MSYGAAEDTAAVLLQFHYHLQQQFNSFPGALHSLYISCAICRTTNLSSWQREIKIYFAVEPTRVAD